MGSNWCEFLPRDVMAYDSASNNRALISGQSALIFNPPSAWAVAKRDAPQVARDCWTFSAPRGPKGRFVAYNPYFWGIWSFSQQQDRGEGSVGVSVRARAGGGTHPQVEGFDVPPFDSMLDFKIWNRSSRRVARCIHYPIRPSHHARPHVAGTPAPPDIAVQIYSRGIMPDNARGNCSPASRSRRSIAWAEEELTGFVR